jgi:hypothetical protein
VEKKLSTLPYSVEGTIVPSLNTGGLAATRLIKQGPLRQDA